MVGETVVSDSGAKTALYSVSKLQSNLDPDLQELLTTVGRENQFVFEPGTSHSSGIPDRGALFFDRNDGRVGIRFILLSMKGGSENAQKLVLRIKEFFDSEMGRADGYSLKSGDLILWSNHTILHGRSAYEPDKRRFLIRMYLSNDQSLPCLRD